jgi:hypothetical protein
VITDLLSAITIGPIEPLVGFLVIGVGGAIASAYYGVWWLIIPCLIVAALAGKSLFRRARKVYREGSWQPN